MSIIASFLKIIVAGIYSIEALQAKQDQKSKALKNLAQTQCTEFKRDQESPPQQLLPFRSTQTEPETHLQQLIAQVGQLFKNLSFGLLEQENVHNYFLHGAMIMVTLKLILATESDSSSEFLMKALQVGVILMLINLQFSHQKKPKQLEQKLGLSALLLVASEYLQLYWQDQTNKVTLFSLVELLIYVFGVTLSISIECFYTSSKLRGDCDIRIQGATNKLANFIFKDTTEDGTQAGYALLHVDTTISASPEVCLLRYNDRFKKLLKCCKTTDPHIDAPHNSCLDSPQVKDSSSSSFARKKALTERLMNQFTSKQGSKDQQQLLHLSSDESQTQPNTFKSIFLQKHSQLTNDSLTYADKAEQLPLLFSKVFSCDNSHNLHGRGILKTKSHSDLEVSVRELCRQSNCFFLKIQHKHEKKLPIIPASQKEKQLSMKKSPSKSPSKKVSFNQHEKSAPLLSSRELRQQRRQEKQQLRSSKSLDDISALQSKPQKQTKEDKKNETLYPDLCSSLIDIQSVSSTSSKSVSQASAQSCAETEHAKTETNICSSNTLINNEHYNTLPLLDCKAFVEDCESIETPSFSSTQNNQNGFDEIQNASIERKQETKWTIKIDTMEKEKSQNELIPQLVDSKNQNEQSHRSLHSSESIESDSVNQNRPETLDMSVIKKLPQNSITGQGNPPRTTVRNENQLMKFEKLQVKGDFHTTELLYSVKRVHTDLAVVGTREKLSFNYLQDSKSTVPLRSDEASKDAMSSLKFGKEILNLTESSYQRKNNDKKKVRQQYALSSKDKVTSPKNITELQGGRSSNSLKRLSCETFPYDLDNHRERILIRKRSSAPFMSMLSGKVYRTSIISEHGDSPQFQKNADLQSMQSKQSKTSLQNAEAKIKANKLFVYKIIHDLRHPTDSVSQGLTELVKQIPMEQFVKDPNLRPNHESIFQYMAHDRVVKALKICTDAISVANQNQSQSSNHLLFPQPQLLSQQASDSQSAASIDISLRKNQTEQLIKRQNYSESALNKLNLVQFKEASHEVSPLDASPIKGDKRQPILKVINDRSELQSLREKLSKLKVEFSSIDIKKIELNSNIRQDLSEEQKQPNREMPQHPAEEEKHPFQLGRLPSDQEELPAANKASSSIESEDEFQIDDNISEGSSKVSCIYTAKSPQKKVFQRDEVNDLVQNGLDNPRNKQFERKPFTLAADRLIFKSAAMEQVRNSKSPFHKQPQQRSRSCLSDVLDVIDSFKEESEGKCLSNIDRHQSERAISIQSEQKFESLQIDPSESVSVSINSPCVFDVSESGVHVPRSIINERENIFNSNQSLVDDNVRQGGTTIDSKLRRSIKILQSERKYLVTMVNDLLIKTITTRNRIETMEGQTGMMMMLLRDLMNQAQLGNNTFTMVNEYFNVCTTIKQCIQTLKSQANLKNVQLTGPILQKPSDSCYFHLLYSDERRYGQFILNFLSNSIKFTPSGGKVTVLLKVTQVNDLSHKSKSDKSDNSDKNDKSSLNSSISANSAPDKEIIIDADDLNKPDISKKSSINTDQKMIHFEMIFRDTGVGISLENQNKLFQNFGKVSETQEVNKSGVGLGLSICKEIINAHGGSVDIESEIDKGTDFIINLKQKCKIDYNWQATMQENQKKDQLKIDDSNISQYIIQDESDHSSESAQSEKLDCQDSDKEILDEPNHWNQQRQKRPNSAGEQRQNSEVEDKDQKNFLKKFYRQQNLSIIDEVSQSQDNQYESIAGQVSRCLLANDDLFLLSTFEAVLKNHFDCIDKVENGQAALDCVKAQPFNYYSVIVLDIQMPIMNGIQACSEILAHFGQDQQNIPDQQVISQRKPGSSKSLISFKSFAQSFGVQQQHPFVYALTSESEPEQIEIIMKAGFKQVFNVMDPSMIRMILENAGLVYRENHMYQSSQGSNKFDADKLSLSSGGSQSNQNFKSEEGEQPESPSEFQGIKIKSENFSIQKEASLMSDDQDQAPYKQ